MTVRIRTHEGTEFVFGRKGDRLALVLPAGATVGQAVDRFRTHLSADEVDALEAAA